MAMLSTSRLLILTLSLVLALNLTVEAALGTDPESPSPPTYPTPVSTQTKRTQSKTFVSPTHAISGISGAFIDNYDAVGRRLDLAETEKSVHEKEEKKKKNSKTQKSNKAKKTKTAKKAKSKSTKKKRNKKRYNNDDGVSTPTFLPSTVINEPTVIPTTLPTSETTISPTIFPSFAKSFAPSSFPSFKPIISSSLSPSKYPSRTPSSQPSFSPTVSPTLSPILSSENIVTMSSVVLEVDIDKELLSSQDEEEFQSIALQFLRDNIGGEDSFTIEQVTVTDAVLGDSDSLSVPETFNVGARSLVFEISVTFKMKKNFVIWIDEEWDDSAEGIAIYPSNVSEESRSQRYGNLCVSTSINGGSRPDRCQRPPPKNIESIFDGVAAVVEDYGDVGDLYNQPFLEVLGTHTSLEAKKARSVLEVDDVSHLLSCAVSHFLLVAGLTFYYALPILQELLRPFITTYCNNIYVGNQCEEYEVYFCDADDVSYCFGPCDDFSGN